MSCLSVKFTRDGGVSCSVDRIGDFTSSVSYLGGIASLAERIGGITTNATREGGLMCKMWQACTVSIKGKPYLEIDPTIVWVLNGWTSNDVYSNTTWNVD